MSTAFIFPGMGPTPFPTVAKFMLVNAHARRLVKVADQTLGYSLVDRYHDDPADYSEYAQVAFLINCLALAGWAEDTHGERPTICAGPSFGAMAAAVYAGSLTEAEGIRLTALRARALADYFAAEHTDVVTQSFTRTPEPVLAELLNELAELSAPGEWHEVCTRVDHDLAMVCLPEHRLEWFQRRLRALGGFPLYVMRPPMHATAFGPLRERVEREIFAGLSFADPTIPLVADQDGSPRSTAEGVRTMLLDGYDHPVDWPAVVATLAAHGVRRAHVAGPDTLFGRVRVTTDAFRVLPADPRLALRPRRRPDRIAA